MNKDIILCADDFAQNEAVSEGILLLGTKNKINAISCLVNFPLWPEAHQELHRLKNTHYIGLHFNLSFGHALSAQWQSQHGQQFTGLASLLKKSYFRQLNSTAVEAEILAQLDAFTNATGMLPDFIDGHQHVHQLPIIRDLWLHLYRFRKLNFFFRSTSNGWSDFVSIKGFPKQQLIPLLGGITFKHRLKKESIPTNTSFAGIYTLNQGANYRDYFKHFLATSQHEGLIMCHPGMPSTDSSDPQYQNRHYELEYFMSDQYVADMKEKSFQLKLKHEDFSTMKPSTNVLKNQHPSSDSID